MVYYFSGTGNSEWAAERIAAKLGDNFEKIPTANISEDERIGVVFPIYAWGCPRPVESFLKEYKFRDSQYVFIIATCGSNCGMVEKQVEKIIGRKVNAALSLSLPNNYIQGGDCESTEGAVEKFKAAKPRLDGFAEKVQKGESAFDLVRGPLPHITTGVVHSSFLKYATSDKSFSVDDKCTSCGACEKLCPVGNITLSDGKPVWNGNCAQCTACINRCPAEAIQYGKHSAKRRRYHFTPSLAE